MHEELASDPRSADFEVRFQLLHMDVDPSELARFFAARFLRRASRANQNLHQWLQDPSEELAPYVANEEIQRFAEGLRSLVEAGGDPSQPSSVSSDLQHGLQDVLDEQVAIALEEQRQFRRIVEGALCGLDSANAHKLASAMEQLRDGFSDLGVERSELLREARSTIHEILNDSQGSSCGIACLEYAFLSWKIGRNGIDAERFGAQASMMLSRVGGLSAYLAARLTSVVHFSNEDIRKAHEAAIRALQLQSDEDALRDAAVLCVRSGKIGDACQYVEQGLPHTLLYPLTLLAEDDLAPIGPEVLRVAIKAQNQARNEAGRALATWNQEIHRIRQAQKRAEMIVNLPGNIDQGRKEMASALPEADLLSASLWTQSALRSGKEAIRFAAFELDRELEKRRTAYRTAKHGIDNAWQARELAVQQAIAPQQAEVELARQAVYRSLGEADKVQSGCALSAGIGCGTFAMYVLLAMVLAAQGIASGPGSILGTFGLIASSIPILFGVSAMISSGMRRSALEAVLRERTRAAQVAQEAAERQAERAYKDHVAQYRDMLHDAEIKLQRIEDAISMLNAVPEAA